MSVHAFRRVCDALAYGLLLQGNARLAFYPIPCDTTTTTSRSSAENLQVFTIGLSSSSSEQSQPVQWVCVCQEFSFGKPHQVSTTMFYEHLEQADTEDEWQWMHA
ncbi:hypothetical protein PAXRUDRAFT_313616 [Paxillus rubicundulus Ve08.2h10]|uniref:Unplaced genomic scaffold scaffold_1680, whole genome shotgun sequence n=1 Tax=Paxillus rubicundulus Ve08.2h10 TaxID=930991 RepID=A0A0D0DDD1_9AGAM|nr:hypothetical protein PAXRUDRAFT_313616 [Paxillus rubicundulus Ve08.2h10]